MNQLRNFPTRYCDQLPPTGEKWLAEMPKALAVVETGGIALLFGKRGTGKTRMAREIAATAALAARADGPLYKTAMELFIDLKASYAKESKITEREVMAEMKGASLLVIDELQERGESDFENQKLTHIVDARYAMEMPTILIANYTREEFAASVSPSILDRIRENGIGVFFDWPSYRTRPDCHTKREPIKKGGIWK